MASKLAREVLEILDKRGHRQDRMNEIRVLCDDDKGPKEVKKEPAKKKSIVSRITGSK